MPPQTMMALCCYGARKLFGTLLATNRKVNICTHVDIIYKFTYAYTHTRICKWLGAVGWQAARGCRTTDLASDEWLVW